MKQTKCQSEFEKWAKEDNQYNRLRIIHAGAYDDPDTEIKYQVWCAAWEAAKEKFNEDIIEQISTCNFLYKHGETGERIFQNRDFHLSDKNSFELFFRKVNGLELCDRDDIDKRILKYEGKSRKAKGKKDVGK
jgi:hypothetical protein